MLDVLTSATFLKYNYSKYGKVPRTRPISRTPSFSSRGWRSKSGTESSCRGSGKAEGTQPLHYLILIKSYNHGMPWVCVCSFRKHVSMPCELVSCIMSIRYDFGEGHADQRREGGGGFAVLAAEGCDG